MEASELAILLGKDSTDTRVLSICETYIESGIEYINKHYSKHKCGTVIDINNISSSYKLAIKQYAEVQECSNGSLKSVDTGDLAMTYQNDRSEKQLDDPYYHLDLYLDKLCGCFKRIRFIPMKVLRR